jgi:hypothetical protein
MLEVMLRKKNEVRDDRDEQENYEIKVCGGQLRQPSERETDFT